LTPLATLCLVSIGMLKQHQRFFNVVFQIFDLFLITTAWVLSYPLRFLYLSRWLKPNHGIPSFDQYAYLGVGIIALWFFVFLMGGVYRPRRTQKIWLELSTIIRTHTVAFLFLVAMVFLLLGDRYSRGVLLVFYLLAMVFLLVERVLVRTLVRNLRRRGYNLRVSLIVGNNEIAAAFVERLRLHPELGLVVKGVVQLDGQDLNPSVRTSLPILGTSADLTAVLKDNSIDQVILALKNSQRDQLDEILASLVDHNVDVRVIPDLHQFITLGCEVEEFEGLPLISLNQSPIVGWNGVAKRVSDVIYACAALLVFSPLMFFIALMIKVFSPGPVFIRQERMGLDGRVFSMLKFRSMRVDAEASVGAVWATKNDTRVTWIGKILRRASLDELPQLINVLRGDMSCVGPRPERPSLVERFKHDIPRYMLRHKVKAGMTGWAQINGWRGDTSLEKRIEYDLYYISNWSLIFDFKIMLLTIFKGFVSKNAY
jgi:Undecaprenyl-phosphate glucose phosphotransferase